MKFRRYVVLVIALGISVCSGQQTQIFHADPNNCSELLKDGVFDEHDVFGSSFQVRVFLNRFCSAHFTSLAQADSDTLNAGIPVVDFMASFGFSTNSERFQTDYSTLCSQQDSFASSSSTDSQKIRIANAQLAQAFVACVSNQHFSAFLDPTDTKQFQIVSKFIPISSDQPVAGNVVLSFDHDLIGCDPPLPTQIGPQGVTINCHRNDDKMAVQLALNTNAGTQEFKIPAFVPDPPQPPFPKGTILLFSGPQSSIPLGWHICDGTNGTVNLTDRFPFGASTDSQIGNPEGQLTHVHAYNPSVTSDANIGGPFSPPHAFQSVSGDHLADHTHTVPGGTTLPSSSIPPATRVYFIQKIV